MQIPTTILPLASAPASVPTSDWTPWLLIGAGAVLLGLWGFGKKRSGGVSASGSTLADRLLGRVKTVRPPARTDAHPLAADLEELTERLCARLDEKAERLEALLARAERAGARLAAQQQAPRPNPLLASDEDESPLVEVARVSPRVRTPAAEESSADPLSRRVYELADAGSEPIDIARSLDEQVGKVQLILALRDA